MSAPSSGPDGPGPRDLHSAALWPIAALAATLLLGVLALWTPFSVDQAIFLFGGESIASGGVLYRDYWDIKQPGIFLFYALAGRTFGFTETGVHAVELAWQAATALLLWGVARRAVEHPAAAALAPLAAVGTYYVRAEGQHMTQVEALSALPLAAALIAAQRLSERPRAFGWAVLLGIAAGVAGLLKLLYLVFPTLFALLLALELWRRHRLGGALRRLPRIVASGVVGVAAVWLPVVAWFALRGALPELLWTSFGYPAEALREVETPPLERLLESARWLVAAYLPWAPLVAVGLTALRRPRDRVVAPGAALWLVVGAAAIAAQKFSWWEYHFGLLFAPLGLLATMGLDKLLGVARSAGRRGRRVAAAAVAALLLIPLAALARTTAAETRRLLAAARLDSEAPLPVLLDETYLKIWVGTRFLHAERGSRPGAVYVFGDPRIQLLSGRPQAIAVRGHGWEHLPRSMWESLPAELRAARPAYVFVTPYNEKVLRHRAPELWGFLETEYRPLRRIGTGRWLVLRR